MIENIKRSNNISMRYPITVNEIFLIDNFIDMNVDN